jgi:glutaminyl-tRNA synthetase
VCRDTLSNVKLTRELVELIKENGLTEGCGREQGALVMMVATTFPSAAVAHRPLLMKYITDKKITTNDQCSAAVKYLKGLKDAELDIEQFEKTSGVEVVVTDAEIGAAVAKALSDNEAAIKEERYHFNFMKLLQPIKATGNLAWADIKKLKAELDKQSTALLGPKTAEDENPKEKPKKPKAAKPAKQAKVANATRSEMGCGSPGSPAAHAVLACRLLQRWLRSRTSRGGRQTRLHFCLVLRIIQECMKS